MTLHTAKMRVERVPEVYFVDVTFAVETEFLSKQAQMAAAEAAAISKLVHDHGIEPDEFMASWSEMNQGETIDIP